MCLGIGAIGTKPPFYLSVKVPPRFAEILDWVVFLISPPDVLDRVPHAEVEVLGYVDALNAGGVLGVVRRMVDDILVRGQGALPML